MATLYLTDDGAYRYARGSTEYTLGYRRPGKYIWAEPLHSTRRDQLCGGGGFRGDTLSWPSERTAPTDKAALKILAKWTGASICRTRAEFDSRMAEAAAYEAVV